MDRHEPTFRLTRDDIQELKIDAVAEFIEWLWDVYGVKFDEGVNGMLDLFFDSVNVRAFQARRIVHALADGLTDSWSVRQGFDSSVTAEAMNDMPTDGTKIVTEQP